MCTREEVMQNISQELEDKNKMYEGKLFVKLHEKRVPRAQFVFFFVTNGISTSEYPSSSFKDG